MTRPCLAYRELTGRILLRDTALRQPHVDVGVGAAIGCRVPIDPSRLFLASASDWEMYAGVLGLYSPPLRPVLASWPVCCLRSVYQKGRRPIADVEADVEFVLQEGVKTWFSRLERPTHETRMHRERASVLDPRSESCTSATSLLALPALVL